MLKSTLTSRRDERGLRLAREAFLEFRGQADFDVRQLEIANRPTVTWRARRLFPLRCDGDYGRGPHVLNVPEWVLWALIRLDRFVCPWHAR